ncbi:hypothetical protein AK88_01453 [Plasmodium fragile]|uniref:PLD phosphodiesterase domain-containing protein n=1 Tax=Plasmodium fragile TaxID=5857 RepID=A0A0D9QPG8_PLAFR|nr:uncharacterized protein AK88_01453 [Plasmodium fragile]KJP88959.1 hypothetical protein AK88_01453 [Plasmodium fragile]
MSSCGCYILAEVSVEPVRAPVQVSTQGATKRGGGRLKTKVVGQKADKDTADGREAVGEVAVLRDTVAGAVDGRDAVASTPCPASAPQETVPHAKRGLKGTVLKTIKKINPLVKGKKEKDILKKKWKYMLKKNKEKYGKVSDGNQIHIYNDSHTAYKDIFESIEKSKKRVWFECYWVDDSELANEVVDSLCNAAKRGCDVIFLIDYIGSLQIKNKWVRKMKESNVQVILFNTFLNSFLNMLPIVFRDHRKIIIVDDIAYCGSMNVNEHVVPSGVGWYSKQKRGDKEADKEGEKQADKEADAEGETKSNSQRLQFYDLHIKVKGPAVKDLADVFIDSLSMANTPITREPIEEQQRYEDEHGHSCFIQVLHSNVLKKVRSIQSTFEWVIKNVSTKNIYITTSYFIPPGFLRRALFSALNKGVDISFLLSGNSDVVGDVPATYHVVKKFLKKFNKGSDSDDGSSEETGGGSGSGGNDEREERKANSYLHNLRKRAGSKIGHNFLHRQKKGKSDFYFLQNRHCHAKNLMVDNLWCAVGSYNWDRYSSRRNLEVMVSIFDQKICNQFVQEHKSKIKSDSKHVTLSHLASRSLFQEFLSCFAYHLAKWSGKNILDGLSNDNKRTFVRKAIVNKYLSDNCVENISLNMMWGG